MNEGIVFGLLLMVLALAGIMRSSHLLREAQQDMEDLKGTSPAIDEQSCFYVRTNYIHITKYCLALVAGFLFFASATDLIPLAVEVRFRLVPPVFLVVIFLAVFLGEFEARTRRRIKQYYREQ